MHITTHPTVFHEKEQGLTDKINKLEILHHITSHNLRGSVANIKMFAEVLLNKNIADDSDAGDHHDIFTIGEAIKYIDETSASLLGTLKELSELSDIQLNEDIKFDDCDIAEVIAHISCQMSGAIRLKDAAIEQHLAVTHIYYPILYMESILYNFINNALKYCKESAPLKISISTYEKDGEITLTVKDNGLGIDLLVYGRKIFNLYQVFHTGYESKGVGLYILKTQIESLGGRISVKSIVDEGSEFKVVFNSTVNHAFRHAGEREACAEYSYAD